MQLLTATLTKPARQVTTKYGERIAADVRLSDGTETTIWRPANDQSLANLTAGQSVTVAKDSKGKVNLIDNPAPSIDQGTTIQNQLDADTKRVIASYITQQRDLLQFCWQQAETISGPCTEESVQKLATTLFLSAQRKFKLA